eukprot:gene40842-49814_t
MVYKAYENRIQWWRGETEGEKAKRCGKCWLRPYQCYCEKLIAQQEALGEVIGPFANSQVEVVIFYTFVECDSEAEDRLFSTIMQEKVQGIEKTCILFPSSSSISFSSWIAGVSAATSQATSSGHSSASDASSSATQTVPSVRLIFLDGTYSGANRLASMFSKAREHYNVSLPFVHLDLEGGLRSAMAGVMYQPAKDKICTFQAMALAIKQLAPGSQLAGMLLQFLDKWVEYLLLKAIKHGKTKTLMSNKDVDNLPTEQHKSIMEARERDFGAVDNKAKKARTLGKDEADDADDDEDDS